MTRRHRRCLAALVAALSLPFAAAPALRAEPLAVILANRAYVEQPDPGRARAFDRIADRLADAGFATVTLEDLALDRTLARLEDLRPRIAEAERLVILVSGHVVRTEREAWLLAPAAGRVSALSVGTQAVPVGALLDLAGDSPGRALLALAEPRAAAETGAGLRPGPGAPQVPQGVAVLIGPAEALLAVFDPGEGLLAPGVPLAEAVRGASDLRALGYLPRHGAFLAAGEGRGLAPPPPPPPVAIDRPSRDQILRRAEMDLRLDAGDRRRVQQSLAILGHDPRGIDGVFGPGTRAALRDWQRATGHASTGYLDAPQVRQLFEAGDARAAALEAEARDRQAAVDLADRDYWRDTGRGGDETGLRAYLDRYPDGLFADVARDRLKEFEEARLGRVAIAEREAWDAAAETDTVAAYRAYLDRYPDGAFAEDARWRIAQRRLTDEETERRRGFEAEERTVAGNAVLRRLVETRLEGLGLDPGSVDGTFDGATRRAIRRFQQARGLSVTGHVDQATMVRLLLGG